MDVEEERRRSRSVVVASRTKKKKQTRKGKKVQNRGDRDGKLVHFEPILMELANR